MILETLRQQVSDLNAALPLHQLVTWTSGNVSGRDPETGYVVIKPSGVKFPELTPENMVVLDPTGKIIEGKLKPSSDVYTHLHIYSRRADINGVVHTHSTFATAFAAVGMPIPAVLTAMCDEFGGPIPIGGFAPIGDEAIGEEVVRSIGSSSAILMQNHGVFTIGKNAEAAAEKAAVMVEDVARTVFYAMQLGEPITIAPEMVARLHHRYITEYGQS